MLVTDRTRTRGRELVDLVARAVQGGVGLVQVREPDLPDDELRELVQRIRQALPPKTPLVVNGSVRVARTLRLGLHLPAHAPRLERIDLLGAPYGRSVHDDEELRRAVLEPVDYLILGTIYTTESKPGRRGSGVALVERICRQVDPLPVFGIGGISVSRIPALLHAGAYGIAVCGAILSDNDPERVAQAMRLAIDVSRRVDHRQKSR